MGDALNDGLFIQGINNDLRRAHAAETESASSMAPSDDLTDAKIAASEARTETKFARLEGQMATKFTEMSAQLSDISKSIASQRTEASSNRTAVITTVMGVGIALFGLIVALVTYGDALFGRGMEVGDKLEAAVKHAVERQMPKTDKTQ